LLLPVLKLLNATGEAADLLLKLKGPSFKARPARIIRLGENNRRRLGG
jgi:hypothetical protein